MKLLTILFVASMVLMTTSNGFALVIDNFNNPYLIPPYWQFGNVTVTPTSPSNDGSQYYRVQSTVTNGGWYGGGFGLWVGQNVSGIPDFSIWVKGDGSFGTLKYEIEEVDGDKFAAGDWLDTNGDSLNDNPTYTPITWTGWQQVVIPFSSFTDRNPGTGNNTWNNDFMQYNIITSVGGTTGNGTIDVGVENMQAIPEPASLLLLGSGLLGMFAFAFGKRKKVIKVG